MNHPFLPGEPVDAATIDQLRIVFSKFRPIRSALIEVREFFDAVCLAPDPDAPFMELIPAVVARYPQSPPYGRMFAEVMPHLPLAQGENAAELELVLREFAPRSDGRLSIGAAADVVWVMENRNGRWEKRLAFRLGR